MLGKRRRGIVQDLGNEIKPVFSVISTAAVKKDMILYLCPDLERKAYLGEDFWRGFILGPEIFTVSEMRVALVKGKVKLGVEEHRCHPHVM